MEEDNKNNLETPAESGDKVETPEVKVEQEPVKTFTRDEVNKMINAEKQKEREAILKDLEAKKAEADKLAKMDEDTKKAYEVEQAQARASKAESELNAYRLKDETIRQASQRGVSLGFIDTIDFSKETAESINLKLDIFEKTIKSEKEKVISEYSKEPAPQTGDRAIQKDISQMQYEELAEYLAKHPEINI